MSMLFRKTDVLFVCVMLGAAAFTYKTKHDAEAVLSQVRGLENKIRFEEDTITVLRADWSLLKQPGRLQKLTEIYADELGLVPTEPTQIGDIASIPQRPLTIDGLLEGQLAGQASDPVTTGAVGR